MVNLNKWKMRLLEKFSIDGYVENKFFLNWFLLYNELNIILKITKWINHKTGNNLVKFYHYILFVFKIQWLEVLFKPKLDLNLYNLFKTIKANIHNKKLMTDTSKVTPKTNLLWKQSWSIFCSKVKK